MNEELKKEAVALIERWSGVPTETKIMRFVGKFIDRAYQEGRETKDNLIRIIARQATLAERKRCADIARREANKWPEEYNGRATGNAIASAIEGKEKKV